ncbi:Hypp7587 [Branchiostoma lanceolatum]|uniref:Hypp7587 protein n=1 Tax=Branchiostoma lanceolatum TaxID=7740 RepID=A0A8J9Z174_BRALA|nr:Hypp7587 [Branchiostoma lanceolatum]
MLSVHLVVAPFLRLRIQVLFFTESTMGPFLLFFVAMATASPVKRQEDFYGLLDLNGDNRLSKNEVLASMIMDQAIFAMDPDGDGFFSILQIFQLTDDPNIFPLLDTNSDGRVSYDEVRQGTNMARIFDREDSNGDGFLDGPEAEKMVFIYVEVITRGQGFMSRDMMDTNGDQVLSKDEVLNAMSLDQVFAATDDDRDGHYSQQQIVDSFGVMTYQMMDDNMDGAVSFGEFRKVIDMGGIFDFFDADASGSLEGDEQNSLIGVYNLVLNVGAAWITDPALDTDGDGKLSKQEVMNAMTLDQIMAANDENGDSQFTEIELLSFFDRDYVMRMDADGDGFVTFAEMRAVIDVGPYFDYCDADGSGFLEGLEQNKVVLLYYSILAYQQNNGVNTN